MSSFSSEEPRPRRARTGRTDPEVRAASHRERKEEKGKTLMSRDEQLKKKKGELKEQEDKLKKMKGQPVGLKKFLEEVVLQHAKLII